MDKVVTLAHGAGGRKTAELIREVFADAFSNPDLTEDDAAVLPPGKGRIAMTTDGFIVSPQEFPGGNIGKLSVCGTVNDLSCMGAVPRYLSCGFILEEGFSLEKLRRITDSMAKTAKEAGVRIVCGDTKVTGKGQTDGVFITTAGVGFLPEDVTLSGARAEPGDKILVTGDIGRHGCAVLLARNDFQIQSDVTSDCAPLNREAQTLLNASGDGIHVIRDATRGGVGTVLYEIAGQSQVGIILEQTKIPVANSVSGVCGMLGLEPLYLACEGRLVVILKAEKTEAALAALKETRYGKDAAVIGEITEDHPGRVVLKTEIGSEAFLPEPGGELLPRIC